VKLVADANVLLSAALGGRASLVLSHPNIEAIYTTQAAYAEVQEYAIVLSRSRRLSMDALLLAVAALPVILVERPVYSDAMGHARKLIGKRDPDDIEILALALHLKFPLWSNDNDFEVSKIEWYTTAELLHRLGISQNEGR
jgi:predicted nucleic acid-binding protein